LKILYDFNKDDIWNYAKHIILGIPKFRQRLFLNVSLVPILIGAVGYLKGFTMKSYLIYGVGLAVIYLSTLYTIFKIKVIESNSVKGGLLGTHSLEITINGIMEALPVRELYHSWSDIVKIIQDKKNIYIHWSLSEAHVVPKRAFSNIEDAMLFYQTTQKFWQNKQRNRIILK
jgi:hypothetical protein